MPCDKVLRLRKSGKNRAIPLVNYTGPKQMKPSAMLTHKMRTGIAYADASARQVRLKTAQEADTLWLNSNRVEWLQQPTH